MEGREIGKKIFSGLLIIFSFIGYFLRYSPMVEEYYGSYIRGLLDGGVATLTFMAIIFYVSSFLQTSKSAHNVEEPRTQSTRKPHEKPITHKVDPQLVKEMINRLEEVERIFKQVYERGGGAGPFPLYHKVTQNEETEFKRNINWLAENYPPIAGETGKAMRMSYFDILGGIKVDDYDPLLQIIQHDSINALIDMGALHMRDFSQNLQASKTRLLAYSGYLKKEIN